jgi:hypothetical protein
VVPPVIHGRSVEAGVLGLDVGLAVTGEGNLSLDPVGEVADAVAVVQGEFQTLVLAAVQVLGRKRDGVEVRKVTSRVAAVPMVWRLNQSKVPPNFACHTFPVHTEVHHPDLRPR